MGCGLLRWALHFTGGGHMQSHQSKKRIPRLALLLSKSRWCWNGLATVQPNKPTPAHTTKQRWSVPSFKRCTVGNVCAMYGMVVISNRCNYARQRMGVATRSSRARGGPHTKNANKRERHKSFNSMCLGRLQVVEASPVLSLPDFDLRSVWHALSTLLFER